MARGQVPGGAEGSPVGGSKEPGEGHMTNTCGLNLPAEDHSQQRHRIPAQRQARHWGLDPHHQRLDTRRQFKVKDGEPVGVL